MRRSTDGEHLTIQNQKLFCWARQEQLLTKMSSSDSRMKHETAKYRLHLTWFWQRDKGLQSKCGYGYAESGLAYIFPIIALRCNWLETFAHNFSRPTPVLKLWWLFCTIKKFITDACLIEQRIIMSDEVVTVGHLQSTASHILLVT